MGLKVQIAPVGHEYKRVIAGLQFHPANLIYLLWSKISSDEYDRNHIFKNHTKLAKLSRDFTDKLEKYFNASMQYEVKTYGCRFVRFKKLVQNLCDVIKEIFEYASDDDMLDEIWINVSTATKLFVAAAQYVASFRPDKIQLFYVNASKYTINKLLDEDCELEDIKRTFFEDGMSYSENKLDGYRAMDVPVVPSQMTSESANEVLKTLLEMCEDFNPAWIKFTDLVRKLEKDYDKKGKKEKKALKMKHHHHIKSLKRRNLIEERMEYRERLYKLTEHGIIFAIIITSLPLKKTPTLTS